MVARFKIRIDHADELYAQICLVKLPGLWLREHAFHHERRWRVDIANTTAKLAVEVEGFALGAQPGRHQRIAGFMADIEKYNELTILGWRLIRCTSKHVKNGQALTWIERALK